MRKPSIPRVGEGQRGEDGHIAYLLRQAQGATRLALDQALSELGLTSAQFLVLNLLDAYPGASGADLARIAQLTPQTVNLVVRKLESAGLVARQGHETHGRVLCMALTATGITQLALCKQRANAVESRLLALLDTETETKLRRWLAGVAMALGRNG